MRRQSVLLLAAILLALAGLLTAAVREPDDNPARAVGTEPDVQAGLTTSSTTVSPANPTSTAAASSTPAAPDVTASPVLSPKAVVTVTGVVVPVLGGGPGAWEVGTPCGSTATVANGTPIEVATVVLDPGHGGAEPGAVSPDGLREKTVNLAVSLHAKEALEREGVSVVLTRTADYSVSLPVRAQIATGLDAKAFVSVHHNAEPDEQRDAPGSETYYQIGSPGSKRLAGLLFEEVVAALSNYDVAWVGDFDAGTKYRPGSRGDYYAVLRLPAEEVTSVLVESAFISNPEEAELLARNDVQMAEGEALARGILRYLRSADPGSGFVEPYPRPDPPGSGTAPPCLDPPL